MKKLILLSTLLLASISFAAGTAKDKKKMAAPAPAAITKVDVTGDLKWTGYGVGKSHTGDLALQSGTVEMKSGELVGGTFTINMESLKTADSERLQGHLQSPDFFDVKANPTATFTITKVEALKDVKPGQPTHKITGDLTIKKNTHPETFMAVIKKDGAKWSAKAETEIKDRTQYGIVYNSAKFKTASALGDKLIEDKIKIELNLMTK
jgi:polyisoprenoid-binding protein YceI